MIVAIEPLLDEQSIRAHLGRRRLARAEIDEQGHLEHAAELAIGQLEPRARRRDPARVDGRGLADERAIRQRALEVGPIAQILERLGRILDGELGHVGSPERPLVDQPVQRRAVTELLVRRQDDELREP